MTETADLTLIGALVAAVGALWALNRGLYDKALAAKDNQIADLRARLDKREALLDRLVATTHLVVAAARGVVEEP